MHRRLLLTLAIVPWIIILVMLILWGVFVKEDEGHYMVRPSTLAAPTWVPVSETRTPIPTIIP